jgi:hypothetical protein
MQAAIHLEQVLIPHHAEHLNGLVRSLPRRRYHQRLGQLHQLAQELVGTDAQRGILVLDRQLAQLKILCHRNPQHTVESQKGAMAHTYQVCPLQCPLPFPEAR